MVRYSGDKLASIISEKLTKLSESILVGGEQLSNVRNQKDFF